MYGGVSGGGGQLAEGRRGGFATTHRFSLLWRSVKRRATTLLLASLWQHPRTRSCLCFLFFKHFFKAALSFRFSCAPLLSRRCSLTDPTLIQTTIFAPTFPTPTPHLWLHCRLHHYQVQTWPVECTSSLQSVFLLWTATFK